MSINLDLINARDSGAIFSDDRKYRYLLWRKWNNSNPLCMFIGVNPSVADENTDDRTIGRVKSFASGFGFGGVVMSNLYSLIATDPDVLHKQIKTDEGSAIGLLTDVYLDAAASQCERIYLAYGVDGWRYRRAVDVQNLLKREYWCLGRSKNGAPRHPLYLSLIHI